MKKSSEEIKLVAEWLAISKENILAAKSIIKEKFAPYHTVCFLCQNSGEKYLKAYLIWNGWELEKIHNLSQLISCCNQYDIDFQNLYPEGELLNQYIITSRYPDDLPFESITKSDAEKAIESAEKIERFVMERVVLEQE